MTGIPMSAPAPNEPVINENKIILVWSFTVWLVVMNTTMFNVALPSILTDLSLSSATASWIVSGYSIVFAISTLTYSRLSDFIPISRLLVSGLSLLGLASIIGLLADEFYLLLGARILQAAGAGAVPGLAMVLAGRYIPVTRRGKAMSMIASAASLGFGLGPVIGGLITQYLGWNFLFAITVFVIILIPFFKSLLPIEERKKVKFDTIGGILTGLSVTGLLLFLSSFSMIILLVSVVLLYVLWRHIHLVKIPFIQPDLLQYRQYVKLLFIGFAAFITHFSALFLMPIMLTVVFNKAPGEIGMIIFPGAILSAAAAQLIGRVIDKLGNVPVILFGHAFLLISTLMFAFLSGKSPYFIMVTYMFTSLGFSALTSSMANEASRILPESQIGSGMGLIQLVQFFGGAFGVGLTGILITLLTDLSPENIYRTIFMGITMLLLCSILTFGLYLKRGKQSGSAVLSE